MNDWHMPANSNLQILPSYRCFPGEMCALLLHTDVSFCELGVSSVGLVIQENTPPLRYFHIDENISLLIAMYPVTLCTQDFIAEVNFSINTLNSLFLTSLHNGQPNNPTTQVNQITTPAENNSFGKDGHCSTSHQCPR